MSDADAILNDLIAKIVRENEWKKSTVDIKPITSEGANYTSALYLVNITLPEKDVKLFAKVAIVSEKMRALMSATRLFCLESYFYNHISKTYDQLQIAHGLRGEEKFVYPKFYGGNTNMFEETVVLENLVARGYGSYNRFKSVDWPHAAASIEALAKFHALSFAYQKEDPESFQIASKEVEYQRRELDDDKKAFWEKMVAGSVQAVKEEHRERLNKYLMEEGMGSFEKFRYPLKTTVIAHGDYRPSNLLYKNTGDKIHAITVDYQTLHTGSPAADLVYFETLGTDSAFRAEYHERLINHYYCELEKALKRLDVDATEVYPREVFDAEMKEMLPYAVVIGIAVLPVVLVEAEKAPRVDDNETGLDTFLLNGTDVYAERFQGIVEDCIRWGGI